MTLTTRDGREVEITVCGESDDVQIDSAVFVETGADVPDEIVDQLYQDEQGALYDAWVERQVDRAEAMMDSMEDR